MDAEFKHTQIKWYHVSVPKRIIVALRKSGQFSMPDMNAALHVLERNHVSSRWYPQQSMADRKRSKVSPHFSKCGADYARCNICDAKCKASGGKTSNLGRITERGPHGI
ncbi:hypothetical protein ILYODFUR_023852 [Ilyodon furcidens]|uniref:Uncharacterized protein n=1 Tax=Ilyodon furcidens TaxID=33524 RepID=A0ABV0UIL5_9TELE